MGSPVNRMMRAMQNFFMTDTAIVQKIGGRMYRGLSDSRIVAQENPEAQVGTKLGQFVEYELAGNERALLLGQKGGLPIATVDFRFFARYIEAAAALYDLFYDKLGATGRYSGTWADGSADETVVKGARWVDDSATDDNDTQIGMEFMQVNLIVPFL